MADSSMPGATDLARRLRELREKAGLTQEQLAACFTVENPVGAATISTWESRRQPVPPSDKRLEGYARLGSTVGRPGDHRTLVARDELSEAERELYDDLLEELAGLRSAVRDPRPALEPLPVPVFRAWRFEDGPVAIICPPAPRESQGPLAATKFDPNYTQTHAYADLDALIELFGHVSAENEPGFAITYKSADGFGVDDLSGHLVLLGGIVWNKLNRRIQRSLTRVPVRQIEDPTLGSGEIFVVAHKEKEERRFFPEWAELNEEEDDPEDVREARAAGFGRELIQDVGYLARLKNPYNSSRTLTICNGIHSRGVLGAVRTLTDLRLREENEAYLAERFGGDEFAVLVKIPVVDGYAIAADLRNPDSILYEWPPRKRPA